MKIFPSYKFIHKSSNQFSFKDILYMLYSLLPCLASTKTTLNRCFTFTILCCMHKKQDSIHFLFFVVMFSFHKNNIQYMFCFCYLVLHSQKWDSIHVLYFVVLACLRTNNNTSTMLRSCKYKHGNISILFLIPHIKKHKTKKHH
jgi:hypothetical protein